MVRWIVDKPVNARPVVGAASVNYQVLDAREVLVRQRCDDRVDVVADIEPDNGLVVR